MRQPRDMAQLQDGVDLSRIKTMPGQCSGQPCIRGLRVTVWDVLDMLASGMSEDEILGDFHTWKRPIFPLSTLLPRKPDGNIPPVVVPSPRATW
jgi:uncharacterized protein (DUF433 family)